MSLGMSTHSSLVVVENWVCGFPHVFCLLVNCNLLLKQTVKVAYVNIQFTTCPVYSMFSGRICAEIFSAID